MTNAIRNHSDDLAVLNFLCNIWSTAQNADNARSFGIWFDDNSVTFMQETISLLWQ